MEKNYNLDNKNVRNYIMEREEIPYATGTRKVTTIRNGEITEEEKVFRLLRTYERISIN